MVPPFVDTTWIAGHPQIADRVVFADVRWYMDGRSGHEAYGSGHVPGAVFVDMDRWLAGDPAAGRGRHAFPEPEIFALGMSSLGIADDSVVIAYDDQGGVIAARLVWMLRSIGIDAALLDGGLLAYDGPLETAEPVVRATSFTVRPWPDEKLAGIEDATNPSNVVIDARPNDRFRGDVETIDARAGHIPGAHNVACRANLLEGKLLAVPELRERFRSAGISVETPVVSYCGSGVTACHNLLALEYCGLGSGRLYPGSWSEYSAKLDLPIETGDRHPID
jgi:thiosulfate/3-mercaptopyruvate sulfurtransferase